jgi:hypothetical protein
MTPIKQMYKINENLFEYKPRNSLHTEQTTGIHSSSKLLFFSVVADHYAGEILSKIFICCFGHNVVLSADHDGQ